MEEPTGRSPGDDGEVVDATFVEEPAAATATAPPPASAAPVLGSSQPPASTEIVVSPRAPAVLQAADPGEVAAAFKQYQQLCHDLLEPSDYQEFTERGEKKKFPKKSAWRKLARAYDLSVTIVAVNVERDGQNKPVHATAIARATAPGGLSIQDGDGYCSVEEPRFARETSRQKLEHDLPATAVTRAKNRAISDLIGMGEVSAEEMQGAGEGRGGQAVWWMEEATPEKKTELLDNLTQMLGNDRDTARGLLVHIKERLGLMPAVVPAFVGGLAAVVQQKQRGVGDTGPAAPPPPAAQPPANAAATESAAAANTVERPARAASHTEEPPLQAHVPPDEACVCSHPAKHHHANGACMFQRCPCSGFKTLRAGREPAQQELSEQLDAATAASAAQEGLQPVAAVLHDPEPPAANGNGRAASASLEKRVQLQNTLIESGYSTPEIDGPLLGQLAGFFGYEDAQQMSERAVDVAVELVAAAAGGNQGRVRVPQDEVAQMLKHALERNNTRAEAVKHATQELRDWIPF